MLFLTLLPGLAVLVRSLNKILTRSSRRHTQAHILAELPQIVFAVCFGSHEEMLMTHQCLQHPIVVIFVPAHCPRGKHAKHSALIWAKLAVFHLQSGQCLIPPLLVQEEMAQAAEGAA